LFLFLRGGDARRPAVLSQASIMSTPHSATESDRKAAYTGLIVGAVAVFIILFAVVKVTNNHFAGEEGEKAAAETTK
jgi:hypothetical protein